MQILKRFVLFLGLMIPAVAYAGDPVKSASCCPSDCCPHCPLCHH